MIVRTSCAAGLVLLCTLAWSQPSWKAVGRGVVGYLNEVQTLYGDEPMDKLLSGGTFRYIINESDTLECFGQAAWNGVRWDSIAQRIQPEAGGDGVGQTFWYLRFQGELYACGNFPLEYEPDSFTRGHARLNESELKWEALECVNPAMSGLLQLVMKNTDATSIYATGFAESLCGYPEACVFRYDGSAFHEWEPWALIPDAPDNGDYVAYVFDFQGYTYMNGGFQNPNGPGIRYFMRYNGTTWEDVPGWNNAYHIRDVIVQDDVLYVCGTFKQISGAPGNLVARFDGSTWDDMAGGLAFDFFPAAATAFRMEWHNGLLFVGGQFDNAAGAPLGFGLAVWDGYSWHGLPGAFTTPPPQASDFSRVYDLTFWRDSLYICGPFNTIDGDNIRQVAQYIGELPQATGISESPGIPRLQVAPNPTNGAFRVQNLPTDAATIEICDGIGRLIHSARAVTRALDISMLPIGLYHVLVLDKQGSPLARAPVLKR